MNVISYDVKEIFSSRLCSLPPLLAPSPRCDRSPGRGSEFINERKHRRRLLDRMNEKGSIVASPLYYSSLSHSYLSSHTFTGSEVIGGLQRGEHMGVN